MLFGIGINLKSRFNFTMFTHNSLNDFCEYTELNGSVRYKIPCTWKVTKQNISGDEVLSHTDFRSKDQKINGFFQVWKFNGDIENFLKESKAISSKQNLYKKYSLQILNLGGKKVYFIEYNITKEVGDSYIGQEYFIQNGNKFYRFSFFMKEDDFKENFSSMFRNIVETLKYN
ncbi:hypothetical protein [Clostridium sp.]|uniref:hypothetical protein n=1 Tax=Clostridium sp. TaxID=1506 RepID=UPI003A5C44DD